MGMGIIHANRFATLLTGLSGGDGPGCFFEFEAAIDSSCFFYSQHVWKPRSTRVPESLGDIVFKKRLLHGRQFN